MHKTLSTQALLFSFLFVSFSAVGQSSDSISLDEDLYYIDASYSSREMEETKRGMAIPLKRKETILFLVNKEEISAEIFEQNNDAGLYDNKTISILREDSIIRQYTDNELIKFIVKIE